MTAISLLKAHQIGLDDRVSLITEAQCRYEGTVTAMNLSDCTLCLRNVTYHGTESRKADSNDQDTVGSVYDAITFWINHIVDLKKLINTSTIKDSAVVRTDQSKTPKYVPYKSYPNHTGNYFRGQRPRRQRYNRWANNGPRNHNQLRRNNGYYHNPQNGPKRASAKESAKPIDCSKPYDFETANAELEKELAKLVLVNDKSVAVANRETSAAGDSLESGNNQVTSSGQHMNSTDSNDSVETTEANTSESNTEIKTCETLCYQPEKSFFDNIGRANDNPGRNLIRSSLNDSNKGIGNSGSGNPKTHFPLGFNKKRRFNRRERALNIETFGPSAAKTMQGFLKRNGKLDSNNNMVPA